MIMFKCDICKNQVPPNTKTHTVVVERREKVYKNQIKASKHKKENQKVKESFGFETVREKQACPSCARNHEPVAPIALPASEIHELVETASE